MAEDPIRLDDLVDFVEARQPNGSPLSYLSEAVLVAQDLQDQADELVGYFVDLARNSGASWAEVGGALGVSKQAAQKRFVDPRGGGRRGRGLFMRFATDARAAVIGAQEVARDRGDDHIGTEHLALALTRDPRTVAGRALSSFRVTVDGLEEVIGPGKGGEVAGHIPFSADSKKTLELALREALRCHARRIGVEHVLLAVLRDKDSAGARALGSFGVTHAAVDGWLLDNPS